MRFALGPDAYDLTSRCLVIATLPATDLDAAAGLVAASAGADVIEVTDPDAVTALAAVLPGVPLAISSDRLDAVEAAYQAGAVLGTCPDPAALALAARTGASVIVDDPAAALAAGIPPDRIALDTPPAAAGAHPVLVTVPPGPDGIAPTAVAVIGGARLIRTSDPRTARRVCDVLAAIFEAAP